MSFLDACIGRLAPHDCLGCGAEGGLLCHECDDKLLPALPRCYRCQQTSPGFLTCEQCALLSPLLWVWPAVQYGDAAKQLVHHLKFSGAQAAARLTTRRMVRGSSIEARPFVVPVPTATSRARQRGYDQAKLLARHVSKQAGLPYLDCLVRHGQTHQVGASRNQRLEQLTGAFRVRHTRLVPDAELLLVDDVITTGASLEAAAQALAAHGARQISAVVFAQA